MLYDLDLIRDAVSAARALLVAQFDQLTGSAYDLDRAIRQAVPNAEHLDTDFIQRLADDPQEEWSRWLRDRSNRPFDDDLREPLRHPDLFLSRLFAVHEPIAREATNNPSVLRRISARISTIPDSLPGIGDVGKDVAASRRDDFRELMLLSAEVTRASALHSAWRIIDSVVRQDLGSGIVVSEQSGRLQLSTVPDARARRVIQSTPRAELGLS